MSTTAAEIIATIREIAQNNPEFVYEPPTPDSGYASCVYRDHTGAPSCLIGRGLDAVGLLPPLERMRSWNSEGIEQLLTYEEFMPLTITTVQAGWLHEVQNAQDTGIPWGRAVTEADKLYGKEL